MPLIFGDVKIISAQYWVYYCDCAHITPFLTYILINPFPPPLSRTSPPPTPSLSYTATEAVISHPDEMENLEQYSVLADYHRKDSHQVNLSAGQVVHVIEKHDTGEELHHTHSTLYILCIVTHTYMYMHVHTCR